MVCFFAEGPPMTKDDDVWKSYTKGVRKLGAEEKTLVPAKTQAPQPLLKPEREEKEQISVASPPRGAAPAKSEPLDLRVERNLSLGDVVIEARLDLHGKTEAQAHETLAAFVEKQQKLHRRLVLVITGRGQDGGSVLRANLPRWCEASPLAEAVRAVRFAAPHHGGEGAYYVLLKKPK